MFWNVGCRFFVIIFYFPLPQAEHYIINKLSKLAKFTSFDNLLYLCSMKNLIERKEYINKLLSYLSAGIYFLKVAGKTVKICERIK